VSQAADGGTPPTTGRPLTGRVAIVTGASRGIGKGCAIELGAAGATVYVTGRTVEEGSAPLPGTIGATAAAVDAAGGAGIAAACDHRDDAQVEALFERVRDEHGRLDVLVNNALLMPKEMLNGRPFFENPISNWDDLIDVGTRSAYVATWFAARGFMVDQGEGLVANVSSSGALKYAWSVPYGVGKAALDRITADTAHELRDSGVTVVSLWPGLVKTERTERVRETGALDFSTAESQRFTGRAIAALAADPERHRHTGKVLASRDLADLYGFTDVDGTLPKGPLTERPQGVAGVEIG
jgi:NAD(P)-dependent dehydrogenase (short-subunit alcohol dehydrogenase family)